MPRTQPAPTVAANCIDAAAQFLAGQNGAVDRILAEHRRAPNGACTGCRTRPIAWPCSITIIARTARGIRPGSA